MPIYEYKCKKCNHVFEEFQSITSSSLTTCPKCGSKGLVRLISTGTGLIFKGSGFYITDYKKTSTSSSTTSSNTKTKEEKTKEEKTKDEKTKEEKTKDEKTPKTEKKETSEPSKEPSKPHD
jgi:putative FmdB family regulatory protein